MVGCWAVYCANQSKDGYLLHRFPKEAVRRAAWKEACNRIDKQPSATSRLCEAHFESDQYDIVTERGDRKLKLTAVPTIFPDRPAPKRRKTDTSRRRRPAVTSCPNCTSNAVTFAERSSTYDHGYARGVAVKKTVTCTEDYSKMTADFEEVPIIEVHRDNFDEKWPMIISAIKSATFVAVDTELSGLGERRRLHAKSIDERYKSLSDVARSRSIISLGLACFSRLPGTPPATPGPADHPAVTPGPADPPPATPGLGNPPPATAGPDDLPPSPTTYAVHTFNLLLLCSEPYTVEPLSLQFLVKHGFDFNEQYARGLPYHRGADKPRPPSGPCVRRLFSELIAAAVPVVFHNALVDLVFLYASLHCPLPATLGTFVADLASAFATGVYDTKYIGEFKARLTSSYLEYVFRRSQRDNSRDAQTGESCVSLLFPQPSERRGKRAGWVVSLRCGLHDRLPDSLSRGDSVACEYYGAHGWCGAGDACDKSHDIDVILDCEERAAAKKRDRRRRRKTPSGPTTTTEVKVEEMETGVSEDATPAPATPGKVKDEMKTGVSEGATPAPTTPAPTTPGIRTGGHRAGYDAFMTGFAFAYYVAKFGERYDGLGSPTSPTPPTSSTSTLVGGAGMGELANKICLSGKDIPLRITKSNFATTSGKHEEKMKRVRALATQECSMDDT